MQTSKDLKRLYAKLPSLEEAAKDDESDVKTIRADYESIEATVFGERLS